MRIVGCSNFVDKGLGCRGSDLWLGLGSGMTSCIILDYVGMYSFPMARVRRVGSVLFSA